MEELNKNIEKEVLWKAGAAEIEKITDGLGKGIDDGIKEAVIAFSVYNFPTSQSCEGHDGKIERGLPYPWVEIYAPEPEGMRTSGEEEKKQKGREWKMENLRQQKRAMELLAEFYGGRKSDFDARLTFRGIGGFGGFRAQSFGGETMPLLSMAEQNAKRELYRRELNDFAAFLKDKYFSE